MTAEYHDNPHMEGIQISQTDFFSLQRIYPLSTSGRFQLSTTNTNLASIMVGFWYI